MPLMPLSAVTSLHPISTKQSCNKQQQNISVVLFFFKRPSSNQIVFFFFKVALKNSSFDVTFDSKNESANGRVFFPHRSLVKNEP